MPDTPYRVRRAPTQYRATRQIERILDATADVVLGKGFAAATTADIAKAAEVSIGSVYRYFPDKVAVMRALVERNTLRYQERVLAQSGLPDWRDAVCHAYDTYVDMCRTDPGFRAINSAGIAAGALEEPGELDDPLAAALADVLIGEYGFVDTPDLRVAMIEVVTIGDAMTRLALRLDPAGNAATIVRTREVILSLVAGHAP